MSLREKLIALLEPVVEGLGYELVELEYHPAGRDAVLRLFIDGPAGITLEDCEKVSHQVSGLLDVEDPIQAAYALEVSSPGLDRPLRKRSHFERFLGARAKVELAVPQAGRRRYTGTLLGVTDAALRIEVDGEEHQLPLGAIERARLAG